MRKVNPIKLTIYAVILEMLIAYITVIIIGCSDIGTELIFYAFYLMPLIALVVFCIGVLINKQWTKRNKITAIIFIILIVSWLIYIIYYFCSL